MHLRSIGGCPERRACLASSAPHSHIQGGHYYYHPILQTRKQRQREVQKLAQGHVESHAPNCSAHRSRGTSLDAGVLGHRGQGENDRRRGSLSPERQQVRMVIISTRNYVLPHSPDRRPAHASFGFRAC